MRDAEPQTSHALRMFGQSVQYAVNIFLMHSIVKVYSNSVQIVITYNYTSTHTYILGLHS